MLSNSISVQGLLENLESLAKMTTGREVTIIGMVSQKITTKNGNIMVTLEDGTADTKLIFMNGSSDQAKALFLKAATIMDDEVLVVRGKVSMPFVMVKDLIWPDIPIRVPKSTEEDLGIAFISDTQAGSKLFMERNFSSMIRWLNGESERHRDLAGKIKYLILGGDVVDGVGVFPNQEKSLAITDVYAQYKLIFNMMEAIPDYIEIFIMPGNHDSVQRSEPQPMLSNELVGDFRKENVHFITNPSYLTLHGLEVLCYHGTSLDSVIRAVPNMSYAKPETAMVELMKRRHLSPIHGGNIIVPTKKDYLVMDRVPDIVHMGHVHKNGLDNYHGLDIVNSGTWQDQTDYQVRQGHIPSPCLMPVLETKKHLYKIVDFNTG
jgi:DNA polymerase II small subunit